MTTVYIVTIEDFKERANISPSILTSRFKQESGIEQQRFGLKILCREFYNEILDQIESDTLTAENTTLLPYLKDYLVFKIYDAYLVDSNIIFTPSGARTQIDTTSTLPSDKQMGEVSKKAENRALFFQSELVNFLELNEDDYPLWRDSSCACNTSTMPVKANSFSKIGNSKGKVKIEYT